jgi:hypothetical protein
LTTDGLHRVAAGHLMMEWTFWAGHRHHVRGKRVMWEAGRSFQARPAGALRPGFVTAACVASGDLKIRQNACLPARGRVRFRC